MFKANSIIGNYRILSKLGSGGMGDVYKAEDLRLGRHVALKVLPAELGRNPDLITRFEREVRAAARLNHNGIVSVFEVGEHEGLHYYSMRMLTGGDLRERIKAGLSEAQALVLLQQLASAFGHAHTNGFVHRDVKPENVVFDERNNPVITDFGIAKALHGDTKVTATGVSIGTPRYISPEQARGHGVDARTDLYALGVILYEMLTGEPPFDGDNSLTVIFKHVTEPVPELPPQFAHLQGLVNSLMAKDPDQRPPDADALIEMLKPFIKGHAPRQRRGAAPKRKAPSVPPQATEPEATPPASTPIPGAPETPQPVPPQAPPKPPEPAVPPPPPPPPPKPPPPPPPPPPKPAPAQPSQPPEPRVEARPVAAKASPEAAGAVTPPAASGNRRGVTVAIAIVALAAALGIGWLFGSGFEGLGRSDTDNSDAARPAAASSTANAAPDAANDQSGEVSVADVRAQELATLLADELSAVRGPGSPAAGKSSAASGMAGTDAADKKQAEEEAERIATAKRQAEQEAERIAAAKRQADADAKAKAEELAARRAAAEREAQAKRKAEANAKAKADEEARLLAANKRQAQEAAAREALARKAAEEDAARKARLLAEQEAARRAAAEAAAADRRPPPELARLDADIARHDRECSSSRMSSSACRTLRVLERRREELLSNMATAKTAAPPDRIAVLSADPFIAPFVKADPEFVQRVEDGFRANPAEFADVVFAMRSSDSPRARAMERILDTADADRLLQYKQALQRLEARAAKAAPAPQDNLSRARREVRRLLERDPLVQPFVSADPDFISTTESRFERDPDSFASRVLQLRREDPPRARAVERIIEFASPQLRDRYEVVLEALLKAQGR